MSHVSLRTFFSLTFLIFIILLTAVLTISVGSKSSEEMEEEIGNSLSNVSYQMADKLDFFMWSRYNELKLLSELNTIKDEGNLDEKRVLLNELQKNISSFSWVGITDKEGEVIVATNNMLVGNSIKERPVYLEAIKKPFVGDVHEAVLLAKLIPSPNGEPVEFVDISFPIRNQKGEFSGVLASHLSWDWSKEIHRSIIEPYKAHLKSAKRVEVFIIRSDDNRILLGPGDMIGTALPTSITNDDSVSDENWNIRKWPDGKDYVTSYSYSDGYLNYPGLNWKIIVREPVDYAFASVEKLKSYTLTVGMIAAILFAVIGWFIAGRVANPLKEIAIAANQLKRGERTEMPYFTRIKDLNDLSLSLREMVETIMETKSELGRMKKLALKDSLTGLPNRVALYSYIDKKLENEANDENYLFLFMDLDGFKDINDTYGHQAGDDLLVKVAERLKTFVKEGDFAARLGGDEFILIIRCETNSRIDEGIKLGESIISSINSPILLGDGVEVVIRCSIGGAIWPECGIEPDEVIDLVDQALYQSKDKGKNQVTFYQA
ncbi:diguanylate cyclase domain-containing protein [Metabacillus sp. YM-086]